MSIAVIVGGIALLLAVFALIPPLPETPEAIVTAADALTNFVQHIYFIGAYIFSPILFTAAVTIAFAVFAFEPLYHGTMWILRKIPGVSIG